MWPKPTGTVAPTPKQDSLGLWVWSGAESTNSFTRTHSDGTFKVAVPDGSFTLDIYANPSGDCSFIGWYSPDGFTTFRELAIQVLAYGEGVCASPWRLPASPGGDGNPIAPGRRRARVDSRRAGRATTGM